MDKLPGKCTEPVLGKGSATAKESVNAIVLRTEPCCDERPPGTLTDEYSAQLLEFYGRMLGWREMESLRLPDRLTVAIGHSSYINIRERPDSMVTHGYEHFGVIVRSAEDLQRLWAALANEKADVRLEPL